MASNEIKFDNVAQRRGSDATTDSSEKFDECVEHLEGIDATARSSKTQQDKNDFTFDCSKVIEKRTGQCDVTDVITDSSAVPAAEADAITGHGEMQPSAIGDVTNSCKDVEPSGTDADIAGIVVEAGAADADSYITIVQSDRTDADTDGRAVRTGRHHGNTDINTDGNTDRNGIEAKGTLVCTFIQRLLHVQRKTTFVKVLSEFFSGIGNNVYILPSPIIR